MIDIRIEKDERALRLCLTASGHANTASPGHDLVCASVSSLIYGFANAVAEMDGMNLKKKLVSVGEAPGVARVEVICKKKRIYLQVLHYLEPIERSLMSIMQEYKDAVLLHDEGFTECTTPIG